MTYYKSKKKKNPYSYHNEKIHNSSLCNSHMLPQEGAI